MDQNQLYIRERRKWG